MRSSDILKHARRFDGRWVALGAIFLSTGLWIRAKALDQAERSNAERRALFVGLWPPMIWLIAGALREDPRRRRGPARLVARARR